MRSRKDDIITALISQQSCCSTVMVFLYLFCYNFSLDLMIFFVSCRLCLCSSLSHDSYAKTWSSSTHRATGNFRIQSNIPITTKLYITGGSPPYLPLPSAYKWNQIHKGTRFPVAMETCLQQGSGYHGTTSSGYCLRNPVRTGQ